MMRAKITIMAMLVAVTPQTRAIINRAFRPDDFEVLWTANPSEALEAAKRNRPSVILLDLNQPLHKGWGILERLRKANPGAPVVVLSEHESIYAEAIARCNGAVLQKPVAMATLVETINTLLKTPASGAPPEGNAEVGRGDDMTESGMLRAVLLEGPATARPTAIPHQRWGINE